MIGSTGFQSGALIPVPKAGTTFTLPGPIDGYKFWDAAFDLASDPLLVVDIISRGKGKGSSPSWGIFASDVLALDFSLYAFI